MKSNKDASKNEEEKKDRNHTSYSELPDEEETSSSPTKTTRRESKTGRDLKDSWVFRRNKASKEKNDPERFSGDGINFKAKIIGIESVFEARGNRMCQDALQKLKVAVKSSGEHKHRIFLNISLLGIRIKDEKTGEVLHHHPVHKISFISQDVNDSRSFGYVFGCPQTGHQFFGIKTEKTAAQVVCALRDLFHAALELKRKEIAKAMEQQNEEEEEENKRHVNGRREASQESSTDSKNQNGNASEPVYSEPMSVNGIDGANKCDNSTLVAENSADFGVDNLLDLKFEMDSLQQGITQMDHSMVSAISHGFGISFSEDDNSVSSISSFPATPRKLNRVSSLYHETLSVSSRSSSTSDYTVSAHDGLSENFTAFKSGTFSPLPPPASSAAEVSLPPPPPIPPPNPPMEDKYAVFYEIDNLPSVFDNPAFVSSTTSTNYNEMPDCTMTNGVTNCSSSASDLPEDSKTVPAAFTELDPLGSRPYVEKQDFFSQVKNPPKKVLKDLVGNNCDTYNSFDQSMQSNTNFDRSDPISMQERYTNPFASIPQTPPKLPPKRSYTVTSPPTATAFRQKNYDNVGVNVINPFNPFAAGDSFADFPPPDCAPPPPPPRQPPREPEAPSVSPPPPRHTPKDPDPPNVSPPPPPRPPNRACAGPTPPRPRRKVSLGSTNEAWFSFNQEELSSSSVQNTSWVNPPLSPPLPLPLRKLPSGNRFESPVQKSFSASNSPAPTKRFSNQSSEKESESSTTSVSGSHRKLTKHMSLAQEDPWADSLKADSRFAPFQCSFNESLPAKDASANECAEVNHILSLSPPLPPKSTKIARPRPSPSRKMLSAPSDSSRSSSNCSSVSSRNGASSSSSPRYSSLDESKSGQGSDVVFHNSSSSHNSTSCFSANHEISVEERSSTASIEEKLSPLSPDSIFRRKSDPFSDDFFMSLPKKPVASAGTQHNDQKQCADDFNADFGSDQECGVTIKSDAT